MTEEIESQQPAAEPTAPVETPEVPASMEDTIRDSFKKMSESTDEVTDETTETPDQKAERERDEKGRFKAKAEKESQEVETPEGEEVKAEEPEAPETPSEYAEPPKSWKKEAQEAYEALPENIKAEIHRRENDFHKGLEQYRDMANIGQTLDKEIQPYADLIRQQGTTAQNVVRDLLGMQHKIMTGSSEEKAQIVAGILRDYQIDTDAVNAALQQPAAPKPDPQFTQLASEVNTLKTQLSQAQLAPFQEQVNQFAADPQNEFFSEVEDDMTALLAQGRAKDLKDAYDKAVWANPDTRSKLMARQQDAERKLAAEKAAEAKRAGSTNVQRKGKPPVAPANGTMEDTIRATYRNIAN